MPDLHGWITQQITTAEQRADRWHDVECAVHDTSLTDAVVLRDATLCDCGGPAAIRRRCAADRKILARHRLDPDAIWYEAPMCLGCGTDGEMADPRTENLNDCPELLDLAEAYGLTPETLASLDRPQKGERPEPSGPSLIPDAIAEAMYGSLIRMAMRDVPASLRGPNWKA